MEGEASGALTVAEEVARLPPMDELLGSDCGPIAPPLSDRQKRSRGSLVSVSSSQKQIAGGKKYEHMNEAQAWRRIGRSLELQLSYRKSEDVAITLQFLQRIPFLQALTSNEMLTVANEMKVQSTRGAGVEVARVEDDTAGAEDSNFFSPTMPSKDTPLSNLFHDEEPAWLLDDFGSPNDASPESPELFRSRKGKRLVAADLSAAMADSGAPTWSYQDEDADDDAAGLLIVVVGKVLLELPTTAGRQHFPVLPYDTFGYNLMNSVLPAGSRYVTAEPCMLVRLKPRPGSPLARMISKANDKVLHNQLSFLKRGLTTKIFTECRDSMVEACARQMLPLRLGTQQVLVEEGEESDAMFFIKEGNIISTRYVRSKLPNISSNGASSGRRQEGSRSATTTTTNTKRGGKSKRSGHVMEVASLQAGEFCGELGVVAYDPDARPGEGTVWTAGYWQDALKDRFVAGKDESGADFLIADKVIERRASSAAGPASKAPQVTIMDPDNGAASSSAQATHDDLEELRYPQQSIPRKATMYARQPSMVYRLNYSMCRKHLHGLALTRIKEYVKGYPSHDDLLEKFEQHHKWDKYRGDLLNEVMQMKTSERTGL